MVILLADRQQVGVSVPVARLRHLWFLLLLLLRRRGFDSDVRSCRREGSRIEIPVAPRGLSGKKETAQRAREREREAGSSRVCRFGGVGEGTIQGGSVR